MRIEISVVAGLFMMATPAFADDVKAVAALPGVDVVKPMKPDWCPPGYKVEEGDDNRTARTVGETAIQMRRAGVEENGTAIAPHLSVVAQTACDFPNSAYAQAQVAAWRQSWLNAVGLSEAEDRAALKIFVQGKAVNEAVEAWCTDRRKAFKGNTEGSEGAQIWAINDLVCDTSNFLTSSKKPSLGLAYALDSRTGEPSQLARLAYVNRCISHIWTEGDTYQSLDRAASGYAFCGADARQLDRAKFMQELDALKAPPVVRARLSQVFAFQQRKIARAKERITENTVNDRKLPEVFIDGADKLIAEWQKLYAANKDAFDAAYAVEDKIAAMSQQALESGTQSIGCEPVRKAYRAYVMKQNPKKTGDVIVASTDPVGYPVLLRLALCDAAEGRGFDASAELAMLAQSHYRWNGPRVYAINKLVDSTRAHKWTSSLILSGDIYNSLYSSGDPLVRIASLARDRTAEEFGSIVDASANPADSVMAGVAKTGSMFKGRVLSVKKTKEGIAVTFKQEKWQEPQYECVKTGIAMYEHDGTPIYSKKCKFKGMETLEFKALPVTLVGATADLVKPGMLLKYLPTKDGGRFYCPTGYAVVLQQAPAGGKGEAKVVNYFGFALK